MPRKFDRLGISLQYPDNWTLDDSDAVEGRRSITIFSPDGPFWSVAIHDGDANLQDLAKQVVATLIEEYRDVEVEPLKETLLEHEFRGYETHFFYLDFTTTAEVRCLNIGSKAYVIFYQGEDRAFERAAAVFRAMTVSMLSQLDRPRSAEGV